MTTPGYRPSNYQPRTWTQTTITRSDYMEEHPYRPGDGLRYTPGDSVEGMQYQPEWAGPKAKPLPSLKPKYGRANCSICGKEIYKRASGKCWGCYTGEIKAAAKAKKEAKAKKTS